MQGKHPAFAERENAADHNDTAIILQEEIRGNAYKAAMLTQQLLPKSKSQQKRSFKQVLKESKFIALLISLFAHISQCIKGRSVRMLHFISSILDLYFTVSFILKAASDFPKTVTAPGKKQQKAGKRLKALH